MAALASTLVYRHTTLRLATDRPDGFFDLTDDLAARVEASGVVTGMVNLHVLHTTAAIVINEHEPLLLDDFSSLMERVAPAGGCYRHDSAERHATQPPGERQNGHSHCRTFLLGPSACLNVAGGRLVLGRWQRVLLVEQDGPRDRELSVLVARGGWPMRVKLVLPALTEAKSPLFRPIKYSLFPPLGLATLAGYLDDRDEVVLQDEHVEALPLDDEPDLVVIQVYITSAFRAYRLADYYRSRGAYVVLGGLHVTSLPDEAAAHADTIFLGPGEDTWPRFLADFKSGHPLTRYQSTTRTLEGIPPVRRDLIRRPLYLVPNSIVVSRGCPHVCDFCYKEAFFEGGRSFYTQTVDAALAEIERLPGRHLYFLDDHLFGNRRFAAALFDGMRGMGRLWQAAGTVNAVLMPELLEKAVDAGLRSLFVGFETLDTANLLEQRKFQNLKRDYAVAIHRLHDLGVMINGSFVFGMDGDDESVFDRTVEWAVEQGIETATFHVLTPYPGTALHQRLSAQRRILHANWDLYDTRHTVFTPARMSPETLERGYWRAYRNFYRWGAIARGARAHQDALAGLRHFAYAAGWKKFEPLWDMVIRAKRAGTMLPALEAILSGFGRHGVSRRPGWDDVGTGEGVRTLVVGE